MLAQLAAQERGGVPGAQGGRGTRIALTVTAALVLALTLVAVGWVIGTFL